MLFITSHTNSIIVLLAVFILPLTLIESVEEVVSVAGQTPTLLHFYTVWLRNLAFSITHQQWTIFTNPTVAFTSILKAIWGFFCAIYSFLQMISLFTPPTRTFSFDCTVRNLADPTLGYLIWEAASQAPVNARFWTALNDTFSSNFIETEGMITIRALVLLINATGLLRKTDFIMGNIISLDAFSAASIFAVLQTVEILFHTYSLKYLILRFTFFASSFIRVFDTFWIFLIASRLDYRVVGLTLYALVIIIVNRAIIYLACMWMLFKWKLAANATLPTIFPASPDLAAFFFWVICEKLFTALTNSVLV